MATPSEIDGARVLEIAEIAGRVTASGHVRHNVDGAALGPVPKLAIARYAGSSEVYLFHCDDAWAVLTDTLHDSVAAAKEHAEFEYPGSENLWQKWNAV